MKKMFTLLSFIFVLCGLHAQETLFDNLEVVGAFGGPFVEITSINGEVGADVGGGGALMLNNLFIGGYGQGTDYPDWEQDNFDYNLGLKHGGLWFGYTPNQYKLIHLYTSARIGWGKAEIKGDGPLEESDQIFVILPEAGFEVNLTEWMKLAVTGGYRMVSGISKLEELDNGDFSGAFGNLTFRFGGF